MHVHIDLVNGIFNTDFETLNLLKMQDQVFLCKVLLHAADLSNQVRPFKISARNAGLISEEISNQIELEKIHNLRPENSLQSLDALRQAESEIYFINNLAKPLWQAIVCRMPSLNHLMIQLEENLREYEILKEKIKAHDNNSKKQDITMDASLV
jgi:hypothetical protein